MGYLSVSRAVSVRLLFASHGLVSIWRLSNVTNNPRYWYLSVTMLLLIIESLITFVKRQGKEWKWFCPSVFIYLLTSVPAIWFLELHEFDRRVQHHLRQIRYARANNITRFVTDAPPAIAEDLSATVGTVMGLRFEVRIPIKLTPDQWIRMLEQLLLLILILGRWLLPKGKLTHDQLSQLLLVYIGTAADIVEFFEAFKEKEVGIAIHPVVRILSLGTSLEGFSVTNDNWPSITMKEVQYHKVLCVIILGIWSLSLVQFSLVLTAARVRKNTRVKQYLFSNDRDETKGCCRADVYGIVITIILQDLPFLVLRMMLIFRYNVLSYTNMFFTSKNTLVIMLLVYRLVVVFVERNDVIDYTIPLNQSNESFDDLDSFPIPDASVFQQTEDSKNRFLMATYPQEYHTRAVHSVSRVFQVKYEKHKWGRAYFFEQVGTQVL